VQYGRVTLGPSLISDVRQRRDASAGGHVDAKDSTTGLLDRKSFDAALNREIAVARREETPLGLIFVDIDRFKKVNDEHGHQMGDQVLEAVAERLARCARGKGTAYRYGGEEIVILLPNHDLNEVLALAERCRAALERQPCAGLAITGSFGVSVFPSIASSSAQLVETADKAMYDAKNRGRNLVRFHGEPAPSTPAERGPPPRKAPEPGSLTEAQLLEMRRLHFKHRAISCPNDGAYMRTHEINEIGKATVSVIAHCPQCGLQVNF
jgi:diguanylate cyclase (GGDEF)-like protein